MLINDHGARTLYVNRMSDGYKFESLGKFNQAKNSYSGALSIAKGYQDIHCMEEANEGILRCNKELSKNLDPKTK